jgi:hypothetical protein
MRAAYVRNGIVETIVEATPPLAEGLVEAPEWVVPGDQWDPTPQTFSRPLERVRKRKLAEVEQDYQRAQRRNLTFGDFKFEITSETIDLLAIAGRMPTPPAIWEDVDGVDQTVDVAALLDALLDRQLQQFKKRKRLGRQIKQAATVEDLDAISW